MARIEIPLKRISDTLHIPLTATRGISVVEGICAECGLCETRISQQPESVTVTAPLAGVELVLAPQGSNKRTLRCPLLGFQPTIIEPANPGEINQLGRS